MRAKMWSRILIVLSFFSLSVQASPPTEPGTRVTIQLAQSSGALPEPEKVVESLEAVGGEHKVKVLRHKSADSQQLTLELWGNFVPQADIPRTLRDTFPVLGSADIQVASIRSEGSPEVRGPGHPGEGASRGEGHGEEGGEDHQEGVARRARTPVACQEVQIDVVEDAQGKKVRVKVRKPPHEPPPPPQ